MSSGRSLLPVGQMYADRADVPRLPSGPKNDYRLAQLNGTVGSRSEETWQKDGRKAYSGTHTCCGSKVHWRHKVSCPGLSDGDLPPDE